MQSRLPRIIVALLLFAAPSLFAAGYPHTSPEGVNYEPIRPSATDPEIKAFDDPHWIYIQPEIVKGGNSSLPADRHELMLWIPGTRPPNMAAPEPGHLSRGASHTFCLVAASLGYHVIALSYPNSLSASSCDNDAEPDAFEKFRMAIITGGASKHITVSRTDSIENRLIKVLQSLMKSAPGQGWDAYLNADGSIKWEKIAVAGQSQGGGHAALIGIHHKTLRVLCFGAPKDYSKALNTPGAWYLEKSETPKELFFAFNHEQDHQGCSPEHQIDNLRALKLDQFGQPFIVDSAAPPFQNSHMLMTNYPGTPVDSRTAHGTMIDPKNRSMFEPVWRYMLTK